jgi:hypothetical protein
MKNAMKYSLGVGFFLAIIFFLTMGSPHAADMKQMKDSEMMVKEGKMTMDKGEMMKSEGQMKTAAKGNNEVTGIPYTRIPKMGGDMKGGKE